MPPTIPAPYSKPVPQVQSGKDRNPKIRRQKVRRIPARMQKHLEPRCEHQDGEDQYDDVRQVRLEDGPERQVRHDALRERRLAEAEVYDADANPALVAAGVDEVYEPVEDGGAGGGDIEVSEEREA